MERNEKLERVVAAIQQTRMISPVGRWRLRITEYHGLLDIDPRELRDILIKLQDHENVIKVEEFPDSLCIFANISNLGTRAWQNAGLTVFQLYSSNCLSLMAHADRIKQTTPPAKAPPSISDVTLGIQKRPLIVPIIPIIAVSTPIQPTINRTQTVIDDKALNVCGIS